MTTIKKSIYPTKFLIKFCYLEADLRVLVTTPRPSPRNIGYAQTSSLDCALAEAISAKNIVNMTNPVRVMLLHVPVSWFRMNLGSKV